MDWKQELLKRLDSLAEKLGTTGAYLWQVLVRQGRVEGIADLVTAGLLGIIIFCLYKTIQLFHRKAEAEDTFDDFGWIVGQIIAGISLVLATVFLCVALYNGILEIANPEYYALHEVLQTIAK